MEEFPGFLYSATADVKASVRKVSFCLDLKKGGGL